MPIEYHGMKPLDLNTPVIEVETDDGRVLDLYNDFGLLSATFDAEGLVFDFGASDGVSVRLRFHDVAGLRVEQPPSRSTRGPMAAL